MWNSTKKTHYIGWINASDLLANDSILIYNGKANVIGKEVEELNAEETTYNFEVEDYHTYYVGVNNILVHNSCSNIDNCCDSKTVIHGEAHGSNIHKNRINDKVKEILNCNEYSDIYLNKSLSTSGVLDGNYLRLDIIGKRLDGTFDIFEFASKSQSCGHNFKALMAHVDLYRGLSNVNISVLINW